MRRFVTLAVLLFFALPFGVSITGCHHAAAPTYCNGQNSGVVVGQLTTLNLGPRLTGISLNQGEIGSVSAPSGTDCEAHSASVSSLTYASSNLNLADINPSTGSLCGGTWNRNTGASIPDYTVCTPATTSGVAYVTASSSGVVSNAIPVFIHPTITAIVLGPASTNCTTDPASNCVDLNVTSGFDSGPVVNPPASYNGTACVSQGQTAQLVARSYSGNTISAATNISAFVGAPQFSAQNPSVVTIDANGVATAAQPGASTIVANSSQASSTAGFFATCPPRSILLTTPNSTGAPTAAVSINQNTTSPLTAIVTDTNGNIITNIGLTYVSTSPTTIPISGTALTGSITPVYAGSAAVTALCEPPTCNPAPFNQIGLFSNSTPPAPAGSVVASNPVQIISAGTNFSTVLYIASTQSQYLLPVDFSATSQVPAVRLPYAPNSMVISQDLSTIYMGTPNEIMVYSTLTNALVKQDNSISGTVLAVSPDSSTIVVTDPVRQLTYLYLAAGGVSSLYGGTATRAQFSPDSSTVYITTTDGRLLVHSTFTGWSSITPATAPTDVAVTVPSVGAYLGGNPVDVRTNCPNTIVSGTGLNQTTTNTFYPDYGPVAGANLTRLISTNDGFHVLGANTTGFQDIATNQKSGGCPVPFTSTPGPLKPFTILAATAINNVLTTSDSAFAFVTYTGTGGVVPQYAPATGILTSVPLRTTSAGAPVAPVAGTISADNNTLFVGTTGDNLVHLLTRGATGFTDSSTPVNPALPNLNGTGVGTPNLLVQKPRKATS